MSDGEKQKELSDAERIRLVTSGSEAEVSDASRTKVTRPKEAAASRWPKAGETPLHEIKKAVRAGVIMRPEPQVRLPCVRDFNYTVENGTIPLSALSELSLTDAYVVNLHYMLSGRTVGMRDSQGGVIPTADFFYRISCSSEPGNLAALRYVSFLPPQERAVALAHFANPVSYLFYFPIDVRAVRGPQSL